jgi:hypothetical protein
MNAPDPRFMLKIPTGTGQLILGGILLFFGIWGSIAGSSVGAALLAIGSGFLAWGTGARWLHHIEAKQLLIIERLHAPPVVDTPPRS